MFRANSLFEGVFQWRIEKQGLFQDFARVVLKSSIFQDACKSRKEAPDVDLFWSYSSSQAFSIILLIC